MRYHKQVILGTFLATVISAGACFTGCKKAEETPAPDHAGQAATETSAVDEDKKPVTAQPVPSEPAKPTMPTVKLTEALDKTCLVKVGDMMPEVTLPKLDGQAVLLNSLAGEKLTVVCFWKADHPYSLEELRQLEKFIATPYEPKGVQVIAINESDQANLAGQIFRETGATYPCLLDVNGSYFMKIATQDLPRTYLLDSAGKILWFDLGYTRSTLRDLEQAIQFVLEQRH